MPKKYETLDEVFEEQLQDPEFIELGRKRKPFNELISEFINRRNNLDLTQNEVAKRAKTFQSRISKIESGEHDFRLSTLIDLADALESELLIRLVPYATIRVPEEAHEYAALAIAADDAVPYWGYGRSATDYGSMERNVFGKAFRRVVVPELEVDTNTGSTGVLFHVTGKAEEMFFAEGCIETMQFEKV